jgi:hypothetical protein
MYMYVYTYTPSAGCTRRAQLLAALSVALMRKTTRMAATSQVAERGQKEKKRGGGQSEALY